MGQARGTSDEHARKQYDGKNRVKLLKQGLRRHEQKTDSRQDQDRDQGLRVIDPVPGDRIVQAFVEFLVKQCPDDIEQGRAVQENDRKIGQAQKPCAQEGVIPSEGLLGVGIHAARDGAASHQVRKVAADDQHDDHAHDHGDRCARRSGDRKEGISGHGKHTPSDHTA